MATSKFKSKTTQFKAGLTQAQVKKAIKTGEIKAPKGDFRGYSYDPKTGTITWI